MPSENRRRKKKPGRPTRVLTPDTLVITAPDDGTWDISDPNQATPQFLTVNIFTRTSNVISAVNVLFTDPDNKDPVGGPAPQPQPCTQVDANNWTYTFNKDDLTELGDDLPGKPGNPDDPCPIFIVQAWIVYGAPVPATPAPSDTMTLEVYDSSNE